MAQAMSTTLPLPGSPRQQNLLRPIAACYENDRRILAALVFGSPAKGKWDAYSDLDLAVVVHDDVRIDVPGELDRVSAALAGRGERTLFTEAAGDDGYLVLESLSSIAISYHPLRSLSPYVLEGYCLLVGSLDTETIRAAAKANDHPELALSQQVHRDLDELSNGKVLLGPGESEVIARLRQRLLQAIHTSV